MQYSIKNTPFFSRSKITSSSNFTSIHSVLFVCLTVISLSAHSIPLDEIEGLNEAEKSTAKGIRSICPQLAKIKDTLSPKQQALSSACTSMVVSAAGKKDHPLYVEALSSPQVLKQILSDIAHEETTSQGTSFTETSQTQFANIGTRLNNLRRGSAHFFSGFKLSIDGQALPLSHLNETTPGGLLSSKINFFINGALNTGKKTGTSREDGFDFDSNGMTLGGDYRFANTGYAGATFGISSLESKIDSIDTNDKMESSSWTVSVYGTQFSKSSYINAMAAIGRNEITNTRTLSRFSQPETDIVTASSISNNISNNARDTLTGESNANSIAISISAGQDMAVGAFTLTPYGKVDLNRISLDAYDETGDSALALRVDKQTIKSLSSIIGFQVVHADALSFGVITEQIRLEWRHEYQDNSRDIQANYVLDPFEDKSVFSAPTDAPDRNSFIAGAGLTAVLPNGLQMFGYVETTLGLAKITNKMFTIGGRIEL